MTSPAIREHQSPLEAALVDVHTTLTRLLVAVDEQYAAVVAHDRERIESVTRLQERLSAQLARAEARRQQLLAGVPLAQALSALPQREAARAEAMRETIATAVDELRRRQGQTANLLNDAIQLTNQTINFLYRLVAPTAPAYGARGVATAQSSILVDSRA
jgi:urease accessory protein UreF